VDVILPDIDPQLCPHGSQLVLLADSFVFDELLAERLLESVEKNSSATEAPSAKPQTGELVKRAEVTSFEAGAVPEDTPGKTTSAK
jgi:hypothetical protein